MLTRVLSVIVFSALLPPCGSGEGETVDLKATPPVLAMTFPETTELMPPWNITP